MTGCHLSLNPKGERTGYTIIRHFSRENQRLKEVIPFPVSLRKHIHQLISVLAGGGLIRETISTTNSLGNPRVALALETTLLLCDFDPKLVVIVTLYELSRHFDMSCVVRKPTFWFPTWSDTNRAVQLQKMARG